MSKDIAIYVINEVRRLCFGGALLPALFLEKEIFFGKIMIFLEKVDFCSYELPTLRVGRSVTRLTVS